MAETALRIFSFRGLLAEQISANDIKSRADARKKGPFLGDDKRLFAWVRWTQCANGSRRRPHFRHYPAFGGAKVFREVVTGEFQEREKHRAESLIHKKAKTMLGECLKQMIASNARLNWVYNDSEASDFSLSGNLLSEVTEVAVDEYQLKLPFGITYRPDIALLGNKIDKHPIFLGAIELELSHEAELLKCLLCKSTGAPLLTIDLHETLEGDIDSAWCLSRLTETTASTQDGRRRNYVFLHNMLYPVFSNAPLKLLDDEQHQFLVFVRDEVFQNLVKLLRRLQEKLGLTSTDVCIQPVRLNVNEKTSLAMFENEGSIAGSTWRDYNQRQYLRVALKRPTEKCGPIYKFHLVLTSLLTLYFDALVGYKVGRGEKNHEAENPLWIRRESFMDDGKLVERVHRLLPKRVSEPIRKIMQILDAARVEVGA